MFDCTITFKVQSNITRAAERAGGLCRYYFTETTRAARVIFDRTLIYYIHIPITLLETNRHIYTCRRYY